MNPDDPKYPKPRRTPAKDGVTKTEYFTEIDTGRSERVLDDGRPVLVEYWYDCDTGIDCVTAFYSTIEIANWTDAQHRDYLQRNGVMKAVRSAPSTMIVADEAGELMWSVNWVEKETRVGDDGP